METESDNFKPGLDIAFGESALRWDVWGFGCFLAEVV